MVFAPSEEGTVWASHRFREYELVEVSSETGEVFRRIPTNRPWFDDYAEPPEVPSDDPDLLLRPQSRLWSVHVNDGLVWVLGSVGDSNWETFRSEGFRNIGRYLDSVIEVYDERTGDLVVSQRFDVEDTYFTRIRDDGRLLGVRTMATHNTVVLWRPELVVPSR